MNQIVTEGIVLNRTNFGEADRILTVLTPDHGRVRLIAKGVRRVKSKLAGGIELFSISYITFIKGKSDIYTLISTRLKHYFSHIPTNIERTMFGYDVLKLINRTVEDSAGPEYFELLSRTLEALNDLDLSQDGLELWFKAQLLKLAGHSPNLITDQQGTKLGLNKSYGFDTDKMVFVVRPHGRYSPNHIKLLRLGFELDSPLKFKQVKDLDSVLADCLQLIKTVSQ